MMSKQQPEQVEQPPDWRIPLVLFGVWALATLTLLPTAQGIAAYALGGGWAYPVHQLGDIEASVGGLLTGHPGYGLLPPDRAKLASHGATYAVVVLVELVWVTVSIAVLIAVVRYRGTGARSGFASRRDLENAMGLSRLHRRHREIRPDLYDTNASPSAAHNQESR